MPILFKNGFTANVQNLEPKDKLYYTQFMHGCAYIGKGKGGVPLSIATRGLLHARLPNH